MACGLPACVWRSTSNSQAVSLESKVCVFSPQIFMAEFKLGFSTDQSSWATTLLPIMFFIAPHISRILLLELPSQRFTNQLYYVVTISPFQMKLAFPCVIPIIFTRCGSESLLVISRNHIHSECMAIYCPGNHSKECISEIIKVHLQPSR